MKPKKRQKLCFNCDAEIDLDVIVCPCCAADLREVKPEQMMRGSPLARPLDSQEDTPFAIPAKASEAAFKSLPAEQQSSALRHALPILLFALGVQLFVLGTMLLLFSHQGTLLLKWDARLWFLYLFASVPFLIFGYRALAK